MTTAPTLPGLVAGTWDADPAHTQIGFVVRHMMVSKVRGKFTGFTVEITTGDSVVDTQVNASIDVTTLDTGNDARDNHVRSADFFDADTYPTMEFRSTRVRLDDGDLFVDGDLTIHGVTKPVTLGVEFGGIASVGGEVRAGIEAHTEINRREFGIDISMPMDGGGVVVGDKVTINIDLEAVLRH